MLITDHGLYFKHMNIKIAKVGRVIPTVIWSEFRLAKYRDDDDQEDTPHLSSDYPRRRVELNDDSFSVNQEFSFLSVPEKL